MHRFVKKTLNLLLSRESLLINLSKMIPNKRDFGSKAQNFSIGIELRSPISGAAFVSDTVDDDKSTIRNSTSCFLYQKKKNLTETRIALRRNPF